MNAPLEVIELSKIYNNKISKICDDIDSAMINKKNLQEYLKFFYTLEFVT